MAELATIATIASLASTALTAVGTIAAGNAAERQGEMERQAANYEARQMDIRAKDEFAQAQRTAAQHRRNKVLALSTLQNRAAGSGFMATDPSNLAIADEIEKYGTLQEQMALYGGHTARRDLELNAAGRRFSGEAAYQFGQARQTGSYLSAGGTILGGLSSMAEKYGKRNPTATLAGLRYG